MGLLWFPVGSHQLYIGPSLLVCPVVRCHGLPALCIVLHFRYIAGIL